MKKVYLIFTVIIIAALQGCMSIHGTFSKPQKGYESSQGVSEPNECNKIFFGTRANTYLLSEKPHAYQIAYYDFLPSLITDVVLLPISMPYTAYIYAAKKCSGNGS